MTYRFQSNYILKSISKKKKKLYLKKIKKQKEKKV